MRVRDVSFSDCDTFETHEHLMISEDNDDHHLKTCQQKFVEKGVVFADNEQTALLVCARRSVENLPMSHKIG